MNSVHDDDVDEMSPASAGWPGSDFASAAPASPGLADTPWLRTTLLGQRQEPSPLRIAMRRLRVSLRVAAEEGQIHSLLLSSAHPGEGRSTVAANLAILMAESGQRVLLIDAHLGVARPRGVSLLATEPTGPGLSDYLANRADLSAIVRPSRAKGLHLLTAGTAGAMGGLLDVARMSFLMRQFCASYDVIIVDGPPCATNTEVWYTLTLACLVDAVVIVARSGVPAKAVAEVRQRLQSINARVVGVVLNDT